MTKDHVVFRDLRVFLVVDEELLALPDLLDQEDCPEFQAFPEKTDIQVNWDHVVSRVLPEGQVFQDSLAGRGPLDRRETRATRDLRGCRVSMDHRVTLAPWAPRESQALRVCPVFLTPESREWTEAMVSMVFPAPKERGDRGENEVLLVTP